MEKAEDSGGGIEGVVGVGAGAEASSTGVADPEDFAFSPGLVVEIDGPALFIPDGVLRCQCDRGKQKRQSGEDGELTGSH
ncbi:hypothetical protein CRG98_038750 [Punica granatum]|uniref:Uncharacterized protein n=1 Tax=Punica granatum TaxID=22663 RepID=A0A2I0IA56_PUNGR|nr:hypothetical protein CRG98_038750 [Punica granatum]